MSLHGSFQKGAKIRLIFKDGRQLVTKFIRTDEKNSILTAHGKYRKGQLRSCNYYKPHKHEQGKSNDC